jgi:superfamily II DNA or RNA helicase
VSAVTGAGKSILIAELCRLSLTRHPDLAVVVSTPTQALVRQLGATVGERCGIGHVGSYFGGAKRPASPVVIACNPSTANLGGALIGLARKVGLMIVDECHGSESETLQAAMPLLDPRWRVGFTATPFRSIPKESLTLWSKIVYRYTLDDALRDGVLVPFRQIEWKGVGSDEIDTVCLNMIREHAEGPGIVSALHIDDAEAYAAFLCKEGVAAKPIHSKLKPSEQMARIAALQSGELRCLVHVNMLAEGVDFPWLRWLCLRRPVGARVRFIQELGRVLRVHPGKAEALVLDPHGLLDLHGIAHPEALGKALEAQAMDNATEPTDREPPDRVMPRAVAIGEVMRWARGLVLAFQAAGYIRATAVRGWAWRSQEPSERQTGRLAKMAWILRFLPDPHRDIAIAACACPEQLRRGGVSDLISVLSAVADGRRTRHWRWPALEVPVPSPAALRSL